MVFGRSGNDSGTRTKRRLKISLHRMELASGDQDWTFSDSLLTSSVFPDATVINSIPPPRGETATILESGDQTGGFVASRLTSRVNAVVIPLATSMVQTSNLPFAPAMAASVLSSGDSVISRKNSGFPTEPAAL